MADMRIDKKLNLVIPVLDQDMQKPVAYVHSTPISSDVFEANYLIIGKVLAAIQAEGLGAIAGPRVAHWLMRDIALRNKMWDGPEGVKATLVAEIYRLTNVIAASEERGWETVPYEEAKKRGLLTASEASEVEAALCFFTVASSMYWRGMREIMVEGGVRLWSSQTTSLDCTAFQNSLPTLTVAATTPAQAA
jgi:hypothetical protein